MRKVLSKVVLVLGALTPLSFAHAQGYATACAQSSGASCGEGTATAGGSQGQPISAARADAMKKRQLSALIRMNQDELLRENAALPASARSGGEKKR